MLVLYAAAVFDNFFISSGPEIELFKLFKLQWAFIDKSKFEQLDSDQDGAGALNIAEMAWLASRRGEVVDKLSKHLAEIKPRDDYREFALLTFRLLGEVDASIHAPGAYHRARWIAKCIYCLKIFGFRKQFQLSRRKIDSFRRICLFTSIINVTWLNSAETTSSPANNLWMLKLVRQFATVDYKVAIVAEKKMRLHLWYLSEDLVCLSLFSDSINANDRSAIVTAL